MKSFRLLVALFSFSFLLSAEYIEAQVVRRPVTNTIRQKRKIKRKVRRQNRRVFRRTLRRLPANTRPLVFRNVSYYPVRGMYFVRRQGVYVRTFPPRGFRLRALPATAIALTVNGNRYNYADGIFYQKSNEEDYEITEPPIGAIVEELPEDATELDFDGLTAYELNKAVYKVVEDGYEIIDVLEVED